MPRLLERSQRLVSFRRKENQKARYQASLPVMRHAETMVEFVEMVPHTPALVAALRIYAVNKSKTEEVATHIAKNFGQEVVNILKAMFKFDRDTEDLLFSESNPRRVYNAIDTAGSHGRRAILCSVLAEVCERLRAKTKTNHDLVNKATILAKRTSQSDPKLSNLLVSLVRHL